jgi:hypothetical protein
MWVSPDTTAAVPRFLMLFSVVVEVWDSRATPDQPDGHQEENTYAHVSLVQVWSTSSLLICPTARVSVLNRVIKLLSLTHADPIRCSRCAARTSTIMR